MKKLDNIYKTNLASPINILQTKQYKDYVDRTKGFQLKSSQSNKFIKKTSKINMANIDVNKNITQKKHYSDNPEQNIENLHLLGNESSNNFYRS